MSTLYSETAMELSRDSILSTPDSTTGLFSAICDRELLSKQFEAESYPICFTKDDLRHVCVSTSRKLPGTFSKV